MNMTAGMTLKLVHDLFRDAILGDRVCLSYSLHKCTFVLMSSKERKRKETPSSVSLGVSFYLPAKRDRSQTLKQFRSDQ